MTEFEISRNIFFFIITKNNSFIDNYFISKIILKFILKGQQQLFCLLLTYPAVCSSYMSRGSFVSSQKQTQLGLLAKSSYPDIFGPPGYSCECQTHCCYRIEVFLSTASLFASPGFNARSADGVSSQFEQQSAVAGLWRKVHPLGKWRHSICQGKRRYRTSRARTMQLFFLFL